MSKKSEIKNKIGFRLSGFKNRNLKDALNSLSEIGYDGVELCLEHPDLNPDNQSRFSPDQIKDMLFEAGLEISAVSFHGKKSNWSNKLRICQYGIELCRRLKTKVFITGSHVDLRSYEEMVKFTGSICRFAADHEIFLAVEPEPGTVIAGTNEMNLLYEEVRSPNLKINLDIGHSFLTEESLIRDILYWNDKIVHSHIEDMHTGVHRHLIPGEGDINFKAVFDVFCNLDYNGYYTIDLFDIINDPDKYAKHCLLQIKRIIRDLDNC